MIMKRIGRQDQQLQAMMSNPELAVLIMARVIEDCNEAACRLLGRTRERIVGYSVLEFSVPVQADGTAAEQGGRTRIEGALAGQPQWFPWRFQVGGGELSTLVHLEVVEIDGRRRLVAHIQDLSPLLYAAASYLESEQRLRQILDQSNAVVFWKDLEGRYRFVNREFCRLIERSAGQILGCTDADFMPAEVVTRLRANDARVLEARRTETFEEQGVFQGETRTYLVSKFPLIGADDQAYAVCGIATDITERKRIEDALKSASLAVTAAHGQTVFQELVRYLAAILDVEWAFIALRLPGPDHCMHALAVWQDGTISSNFDYDLAGTPCETVVGWKFCLYPDRVPELFPDDTDFASLGMVSYAGYPLSDRSGRPLGLISVASRRPLADSEFVESVMKIFAVRAESELERDRMDRELRVSEESYRAIFEASEDCIFIHDIDTGAFVDVNRKACEVYGYDYQTLLTLHPGDLGTGEAPYTEADADRWLDRARSGEIVRFEWQRRNADGGQYWDEVILKRIRLAGVDRILAVTHDITARKRADEERSRFEAQLRQAQKMEAIGHLAGGIAHDFNNILTSITGYLALAAERQAMLQDPRLGRYLEQTNLAANRARDLIRQLLTFSRGRHGTRRTLSLSTLVDELSRFLGPMLPSSIAFSVDTGTEAACVMADPVQLEQVLMNLCINARDAVGSTGGVRIAVEPPAPIEGVCASCRSSFRGDFATLSVIDDGPGIAPEVLERMFEPFFTTKEVGKGSGMGLATVHGIVHEHGGHVLVVSRAGRGTSFRVLLPALPEQQPDCDERDGSAAESATERLDGRVLLVDDDEMVTGFLHELLESWGLEVTVAGDGLAAREAFAAGPEAYDLVLTDQTMPRMSGVELTQAVQNLRPGIPVVLITGYADRITDDDLRAVGASVLLHKPVEPGVLFSHLGNLLRGRPVA